MPAGNDESNALSVEPAGDLAAPEEDIGLPWDVLRVDLARLVFDKMKVEGPKDKKDTLPFLDYSQELDAIQRLRQKSTDTFDLAEKVYCLAL
jgi:hypothetical protein